MALGPPHSPPKNRDFLPRLVTEKVTPHHSPTSGSLTPELPRHPHQNGLRIYRRAILSYLKIEVPPLGIGR